ncbi:2'-5' RNA ligase family protein [Flammeovirga sp. SJP92]|uniref:2'-5' RNA ligase family protein n=1 Tax=Flammeovirga sp. SJP92 TaxID=1775430 RepID=UPI0007896FB1|nr:mutarotase [Flammeovirga sp. SJP92]KXX71834.1 mutarotase [Flammeovirga sp. SJP92]
MNNIEFYNNLYHESVTKIKTDNYQLDKLIDAKDDRRFGISLILKPDELVLKNIQGFLSQLRAVEPRQYFYPDTDIHVTVMSIITCYDGFSLDKISIDDYINTIKKSLDSIESFDVLFKGLTASPSCILLQGFVKDNVLNNIRNRLRSEFKSTSLEQSFDIRYVLQTAHSTIVRLKERLEEKNKFLDLVEKYRNYYFGTVKVKNIDLVYNDWYQRKDKVKGLYQFPLQ